MEAREMSYEEFGEVDGLTLRSHLFGFRNCHVWTARLDGLPALVLSEPRRGVTVCVYDDPNELRADTAYLASQMPPPGGNGPAGAGTPVFPRVKPPSRPAGNARPFPPTERN